MRSAVELCTEGRSDTRRTRGPAVTDAKRENLSKDAGKEFADTVVGLLGVPPADRKWIFIVGAALVAVTVPAALIPVLVLANQDKEVPNEFWILVTSVVTAILGGLFGYPAQKH